MSRKITKEIAERIKIDPRLNKEIAKDYNLHISMIRNIKKGKSWNDDPNISFVKCLYCTEIVTKNKMAIFSQYCSADCKFYHNINYVDGCWLWKGSIDSRNHPILRFNKKIINSKCYSYEKIFRKLSDKEIIKNECSHKLCVNPVHLKKVPRSYYLIEYNKENTELKKEIVEKIRKDPRSANEIAKEYNITSASVYLIKKGMMWGEGYDQNKIVKCRESRKGKRGKHINLEVARKIRRDIRSNSQIANEYGISSASVSLIKIIRHGKKMTNESQYDWKDALTPKGDDDDLRKQIEKVLNANVTFESRDCYALYEIPGLVSQDITPGLEFCLGDTLECFVPEKDPRYIHIVDGCDQYFGGVLNKQQFGWIIRQLQKLHEMMDE